MELAPAGLRDGAGRWARLLHDRGVSAGDRVGLLADNSATYLQVLAGAARIGAAVVLLNPRLTPTDLRAQLADSGAAATLSDSRLADAVAGAWILDELAADVSTAAPLDRVAGLRPGSPFVLLYTSGTTGTAKGCVLSHRAWAASAANTVAALGLGAHDRYLGRAPFFHVAGLSVATAVLAAGGTVVFDGPRSPSLEEQWQLTVRLSTTVASFSASLTEMARAAPASSSLRVVFGQAGRWSAAQHAEAVVRLPLVRFAGFYGQTEAGNFVTRTTRDDETVRPGTVGRPLPAFRAAVLDEHLRAVPPGESGELCVRGPSTMTGYWGQPEATAEALRGGWLHTGDVVRADEDGYLYLLDRLKDMVKPGGENVYCVEVERVLLAHPDVADCAVVGVPDPRWGEGVKAVVVGRGPITPADLDRWCLERLAAYKRPRWYELVETLPRSAGGKVDKRRLRSEHDPARAVRLAERDLASTVQPI